MTRRRIAPMGHTTAANKSLAEKLASELKNAHEYGQPFIYEQEYRTGKLRINVVWDEWRGISLPERSATILRAYEIVEGPETRDRIALASGLTVPEAHEAGMLPFEILAALRKGDSLQWHEVEKAKLEEGGSRLFHPLQVKLLLATQDEAEASQRRLVQRHPGSEEVWIINREITPQDYVELNHSVGLTEG